MAESWYRKMMMLVLGTVAGCSTPGSTREALTVSPDAIIIDVRTRQEFDAGHVTSAVNIPYDVIADRIGEVTTDKQQEIVVYCRSGHRAGIAQRTLGEMGFSHVENAGTLAAARALLEPKSTGN